MSKYRWIERTVAAPEQVTQLQRDLNDLPEPLAKALVLRGVDTFEAARSYFRPKLADLHDPFLMQDMDRAADRVARAIRDGEHIVVYGDYDVDGTTATALMTGFLRSEGATADFFIPDRIKHGYGLGQAGIDWAAERGATLIVALDCGITAHAEANYARSQGIDLVICDHHKAEATIPDAVAVLDPKRPDCSYPFKELCGCGVGFKLIQAVMVALGKPPEGAYEHLGLVAIATASDIVPLYGENRILMREGLEALRLRPRLGLRTLAEQANLDLRTLTSTKIVFTIGPRINAAGRLGDAGRAVELMMTDDPLRAHQLATQLEAANHKRRQIDYETQEAATTRAKALLEKPDQISVVLHDAQWHPGVIGIVASRLVERFHRPTVMLTTVDGVAKGSARSIETVNIYQALTACSDLLTQFGGHDYAAGMTLPVENIPAFQQRFNEAVQDATSEEHLARILHIDATVPLPTIDQRFWAVLKQFAPHGPQNMTPVFQATNLEVVRAPKLVGKDQRHLRFTVAEPGKTRQTAKEVIGFNMSRHHDTVAASHRQGRPLDLAFTCQENTWNGRTTVQLRAKDLRLS